MTNNKRQLKFRVSSGLKNIIGRDLISDKYIAIFELVKNSYDAQAHSVNIMFEYQSDSIVGITVSDDGIGMDYSDIINKWLFVAYSEKKKQNRKETDYRNEFKRNVAGAKGVGRFSCDRLGSKLRLITKKDSEKAAHYIDIDWNNFESDELKEFIDIPVEYHTGSFPNNNNSGAILEITELREDWDRASIIKLKKSLMKLISPDLHSDKNDSFEITIYASGELVTDNLLKETNEPIHSRDLVNGLIVNDIFERLNIKTTSISLDIAEDGKTIKTELSDRGTRIFSILEKNTKYSELNNIHISLFYLNRAAKTNFTRLMGVEPVNYGSVFIYKNGFRVYPYGEPNEDFFGIDKRKAQGYNRFLGTREIMGRISINNNDDFIETSSRAHGFIVTKAVETLSSLFLQKVLKVLERYVVNIINWNNPIHTDSEIKPEDVSDKIISEFADLSSRNDILSIDYNETIFSKASKVDANELVSSISKLEKVAERTQNSAVSKLVADVKKRTDTLRKQNDELERENRNHEAALVAAKRDNEIKEKQVYFLKGATNTDIQNLMNGMHSVFTQSEALAGNLQLVEDLLVNETLDIKELVQLINEIKKSNQKINKTAELAIHGAQNLKAERNEDICAFISEYLSSGLTIKGVGYELSNKEKHLCYFDSASIGLIIDNIFSNSLKAHADKVSIDFSEDKKTVIVAFRDNGVGLGQGVKSDTIFEYGATTTSENSKKGFGIGLCYIKQLIEEMGGSVVYDTDYKKGFGLLVRLRK